MAVVQHRSDPALLEPWGDYEYEKEEEEEDYNYDHSDDDIDASQPPQGQEDEDSDIDADLEHAHGPSTSNEKRRAQNEIFRAFAAQKAEEITEKEVQEVIKNTKEDQLSIRDMLAKAENSAQIRNPRDYQTELFQRAKEENIIAVLDTGSGKTHIATLLLRHILDVELENRSKGSAPKVAFFLVNSVNLVFQQSNVLRCGLDQKVEGICGAMGSSLWSKKTWDKHLQNNMVIVCTAEVLVQCLMHSFINISMINLLIFDEAHHTKSNHPYARLIKDYYLHEPDFNKRPRIFGMTASPVDANVDVHQAAKDLETLLHCKIATTSDLSLLANHITRPEEKIAAYSTLKAPFETPFHQELKARYGDIRAFRKLFLDARIFSSELGSWASDAYWSFAFSEEEGRKMELRQERIFNKKGLDKIETLDKEIAQLKEAAGYVRDHAFGTPTRTGEDLSSKVITLGSYLQAYYERTGDSRCIVFVERRHTARLLHLIFKHLGGPNLHGDILVGNSTGIGDQKVSVRSQFMTVVKFRKGELNCLFATSVAEEGLDIPQCNLVVRFDLYKTMIGYVQSRGRARHRNSRYLHMVEINNSTHQSIVANAKRSEQVMRNFCNGLSSDRLIDEDDDPFKYLMEEQLLSTYTDPISGAKLTYRSSLAVLAHFVACLPIRNQEVALQPTYVVIHEGGQFICEVILPDGAPITSLVGSPCQRKALARCSAAFELCLKLREGNYLDENLLSTLTKSLPEWRNAQVAISSKKKDLYTMRIKPNFWNFGYDTLPEHLYLTVIDVSAGLERPHQPLGLITRTCFPQMPEFPVYLADGRPSNVFTRPLPTAIPATDEKLRMLTTLTLQVYDDIFAKVFEYDVAKMSYWLVPLRADRAASSGHTSDPDSLIDWEQVREICENREYRWTKEMSNDFLKDKYIVDPNDGGRRFYSLEVRPHLHPRSAVPGMAPRYKYMADILDYSVSLWAKSRAKWEHAWDESQPVVEVEKIPFRRNFLACVEKDEDEVMFNPKAFVCPQPLRISSLTTRFVAMCYVFPAIIHRYEAYLVAIDACTRLKLNIGPRLALEALTKDSENSDEHGETQIKFKSGMGPNYERLEFMGDCFLKMATSISTFVLQPDENEFEFHVRRMKMLCNLNLFNAAKQHDLQEYVRSMAFSRRTWYPEGLKMTKGKGMKKTGPQVIKHRLGDKTVADVCEAFIGAAFMEHNDNSQWDPRSWDEAVKAVKTLVLSDDHLMEKYSDYYAAYLKPKYQVGEVTASQLDMARKIEQKHPYHFKYPRLLRSAFIHPSQAFMWENIPNYQRLEFLGDSLLDQVFIMHIFYNYPDKDPQWLTEHKMPMVSNKFLGALCVKLGFHRHIRQNNSMLMGPINYYVVEVEEAEREAEGAMDYWMTTSEPPKCLADVVEAFVAAMFVDSEFDFTVVQTFFDMHIKRYFMDMSLYDNFANNHPTTRLTKLIDIGFGCKDWRMAVATQKSAIPGAKESVIAMVLIHMTIHFHATRENGRYARVAVSNKALEKLEGLPPYEFRSLYGCNCHINEDSDGEDKKTLAVRLKEVVEGSD